MITDLVFVNEKTVKGEVSVISDIPNLKKALGLY